MTNTFHDKFLKAQAEFPKLQKDGENPHFRSSFITLDNLLAKVLPVLNKNGLSLIQSVTSVDGVPALLTSVSDGENAVDSTMLLMMKSNDPQGQGSAITYARRYSLMALLGLAAGEDDDGNAANAAENARQEHERQKTSPVALAGFYSTLKGKGVTSKEDANRILAIQDERWDHLNTSGIARMQKALDALQPDTIEFLLQGEEV